MVLVLVAKLVAALSLPNAATNVADPAVELKERLKNLEDGSLFQDAGIVNILAGDFFAWYLDDVYWDDLKQPIEATLTTLQHVNFDIERKELSSVRDLFKGMYETFMPRALRHAMGEFYTPDWLAAHALDKIGWNPNNQLLDPTCGTGTFLLEAIKRRLMSQEYDKERKPDTRKLLEGIYGMDLNPLAVLAARASIVVFLSPYITPENPVTIPVWMADAINSSTRTGENFEHQLLTEKGLKTFKVPSSLVNSVEFHRIFLSIMELINTNMDHGEIEHTIRGEFNLEYLDLKESQAFAETIKNLVELHAESWDGIWCPILADRFTAGAIPKVSHIAGNPPWVKWSHLPPEYANFIKEKCRRSGVFSQDTWFGGIESDISTVITFEAMRKWLEPEGKLAFYITGTIFSNESSQGFRKMQYYQGQRASIQEVEDFKAISPFEGVSNHPTLITIHNGSPTIYPVGYRIWNLKDKKRRAKKKTFNSWEEFEKAATPTNLLARPVYGSDEGPWLKGTASQHEQWPLIFKTDEEPNYLARKGVCTDRNGIFFVKVSDHRSPGYCSISNNPSLGRKPDIQAMRRATVETDHVFPLIRGKGVSAFQATADPDYFILLPQKTMHGNPELPREARNTYRYLTRFKTILEGRSSYRRYQKGQPFWSIWNVGPYTFAPYKVVWKEMSGNRFQAAYISNLKDNILGNKLLIPDHKVYFVPAWNEDEAAYLTGMLNAPSVAQAVSAYSPNLSLGVNVVEHLAIPTYNQADINHRLIAGLSKHITERGKGPYPGNLEYLDHLAHKNFRNAKTDQSKLKRRTSTD